MTNDTTKIEGLLELKAQLQQMLGVVGGLVEAEHTNLGKSGSQTYNQLVADASRWRTLVSYTDVSPESSLKWEDNPWGDLDLPFNQAVKIDLTPRDNRDLSLGLGEAMRPGYFLKRFTDHLRLKYGAPPIIEPENPHGDRIAYIKSASEETSPVQKTPEEKPKSKEGATLYTESFTVLSDLTEVTSIITEFTSRSGLLVRIDRSFWMQDGTQGISSTVTLIDQYGKRNHVDLRKELMNLAGLIRKEMKHSIFSLHPSSSVGAFGDLTEAGTLSRR